MKKTISIIIFILLITSSLSMATNYSNEHLDIKVGKGFNRSAYPTLSSKDGFYIYDKFDKSRDLFQIIETNIIISLNNQGDLDILDLQNNIIETIPGDGSVIIGSGSPNNSMVQVDKNSYRDFVSFKVTPNNITLINHIDIEKYLYGVVPKEVGSGFPTESIKAQAVAARTFAMANINKHKAEGFNLCDTTHCQVYGAVTAEHPKTSKAVDHTRAIYVYYDGRFADTTFHSNNGGYIESSKDVWGGHLDYLIAKEDPFSVNTTGSTWNLKLTAKQISDEIYKSGLKIGNILDMEVLEITQGNRVSKLRLIGSLGEEVISGDKLRGILGNTTMKSTWFSIRKDGEDTSNKGDIYIFHLDSSKLKAESLEGFTILDGKNTKSITKKQVYKVAGSDRTIEIARSQTSSPKGFIFEGRGYGHGVGMSQYGAAEMGRQGFSYEEILKHYYTGVDIR